MEEEEETLWEVFLNSLNTPNTSNLEDTLNQAGLTSLFEDEDEDDPDFILKDLETVDFDEDLTNDFETPAVLPDLGRIENYRQLLPADVSVDGAQGPSSSSRSLIKLSPEQSQTLYGQLCFHVQSLTQLWVQSLRSPDYDDLQKQSKQMLNDLSSRFNCNNEQCHATSLCGNHIQNLSSALNLIETQEDCIRNEEKKSHLNIELSMNMKQLFSSQNTIFLLDWALPSRKLDSSPKSLRKYSFFCEDHLIAFGLKHFFRTGQLHHDYKSICDKFLPWLNFSQIRFRVNSLKRSMSQADGVNKDNLHTKSDKFIEWYTNPIVHYLRTKQTTPVVSSFVDPLHDTYHNYRFVPAWYIKLTTKEKTPPPSEESSKDLSMAKSVTRNLCPLVPKNNDYSSLIGCNNPFVLTQIDGNLTISPFARNHDSSVNISNKKRKLAKKETKSKKLRTEVPIKVESPIVEECLPDFDEDRSSVGELEIVEQSSQIDHLEDDEAPDIDSSKEEETCQNSDTSVEKQTILEEEFVETCENVEDENDDDRDENKFNPMDDENDLMALMEASWTPISTRVKHQTDGNSTETGAKRKAEIISMQRDSSMFIMKKDIESHHESSDSHFDDLLINYFFQLSQKIILPKDYVQLLSFLSELLTKVKDNCDDDARQVYSRVIDYLRSLQEKYSNCDEVKSTSPNNTKQSKQINRINDLIELVGLFLNFRQSVSVHQAFNHLHWKRIFAFIRKIQNYLHFVYGNQQQKHNGCVQRMIRSLNQLQQTTDCSADNDPSLVKKKMKTILSKVLNNHPLLMEELDSIFLDEPPPSYLCADPEDFDEFDIEEEQNPGNNFENTVLKITDADQKYGTVDCPCDCHRATQTDSNSVSNHCPQCGIRFLSGRIYLPHVSSGNNRKVQMVEYVPVNEEENISDDEDSSNQADQSRKWQFEEDKLMLTACRSLVIDTNVTKLTDEVVERVANKLKENEFESSQRTSEEIASRLKQLIDMLISNTSSS